jgi:hypothetical protein
MTKSKIEIQEEKIEIHVPESDTKDLTLLDRSDIVFAVLYGGLFVWGLVFTLISI